MSVETEKAILPHGWIVKTSAKYPDRVYYFNLITGCSTWECPELMPKLTSDGFKEPESKKNLNKSSESESEMGGFVAGIHTPEESPKYSKTDKSSNNNINRKSLKRPLEVDITLPIENASKALKPPTAIVNPVISGPEKKPSTSTSISSTQAPKSKRKRKSNKNKNKITPPAELIKNIEKSPKSGLGQSKKVLYKNKFSIGQDKASTSTATCSNVLDTKSTNSSSAVMSGTLIPTSIALTAGKSFRSDAYEDSFCGDVEMIDVSANLTSVEEIVAAVQDSNQLHGHYVVVDTNVFMHELDHIDELKDTPLQGCGPPHIFVPWVVFKELDGLKLSVKNAGSCSKLASRAIRFLHNILKSKHPRFHGQNAKQAEDCKKYYHDNNDDRIIDLCHTLQKKVPPEKVILLTNDKNLANKAMVYNIIVHDWESLMKDIKPDVTIQEDPDIFFKPWKNMSYSKKRKNIPKKDSNQGNYLEQKHTEHILVDQLKVYKEQIDKVMKSAKRSLKDVLDPLLLTEMRRVYDEKCWDVSVNQNSLQDILTAYIKHWSTLFCFLFSNDARNNFEILRKKLSCSEEQYNRLEDCVEILNAVQAIFEGIRVQDPKLRNLVREIENLKGTCTYIFTQCQMLDSSLCVVESNSRQTEEEKVLEIFNYNWTVVNELCGMIMDFFGIHHSFGYIKPEIIPPESEFRRVTADLYPFLLQLRQLMKKMLIQVKNSDPSKSVFKRLWLALKELVPSLNVKFVMPDLHLFSPNALDNFCHNPENRQKIELGFKQLDQFCNKLKEAIQAMIAQKKPQTSLL